MTNYMVYIPRHFIIQELVPPSVYSDRGSKALELMNPRILIAADALRGRFGPIIVNNWHTGGNYKESGYRTPDTPTGARYSMHRLGGALDMKFRDTTPQEVYAYILANPDEFPEITCLENIEATPTWLHADCRNCERIKIVNP